MIFSTRAPLIARTATVALCLACVTLALAAGTTALAASVIHFQPEGLPALKGQLGHHEVHALTFHPATGTGHIHVSLNDGGHMTVPYATAEQAQLVALAGKDGATVAIAAAKPKAVKAPVHHKLRYVAAGILVVVIVVIAAVLLVDRRRRLGEAGGDQATESALVPPPPGDPT